MKNIYTWFFLLISFITYSQNLTLDELLSLRKKDLATIEEKLTLKGWSFIKGTEPDYSNLGEATFAFNKSSYEDKAESFLSYMYSDVRERKRIDIQISKKDKYNLYLARIKSLGCKLIDSKISDGSIKKAYQGATTTFIVTISTQEDFQSTKTVYHILIVDNIDYRVNFQENILLETNESVADTTAVTEVLSDNTTTIYSSEEEKPKLTESYLNGTWKTESVTFRFLSNGEVIQKFEDGTESVDNWRITNGKLSIGMGINLVIYNIYPATQNSFSYNTNKLYAIIYAYRQN